MKQILLATVLIALPVAGFSAFTVMQAGATVTTTAAKAAGLGDLTPFSTIIADVQSIAAKGDLPGAKARIKDFELAWDAAEVGLKPLDGAHWHRIDGAADGAFTELRAAKPDPAAVTTTLAALMATLTEPAVAQ